VGWPTKPRSAAATTGKASMVVSGIKFERVNGGLSL